MLGIKMKQISFTDEWWKSLLLFLAFSSILVISFTLLSTYIESSIPPPFISILISFIILVPTLIIELLRPGFNIILLRLKFDKSDRKNLFLIIVITSTLLLTYSILLVILGAKVVFFEYFEPMSLMIITTQIFFLSFLEELIFRGILLQELSNRFGKFISVFILSLLFALLHINNQDIDLTAFINIFLMGISLSVIFIQTQSLILTTILHFLWNAFQALILGWKVSGYSFYYSITQFYRVDIPNFVTGGAFGMENTLFATLIIVISTLLFLKYLSLSPYIAAKEFKIIYSNYNLKLNT